MTGNKTNGFTLVYPDGSKDFYGLIVTNTSGKLRNAFLTERWNAIGQKTRLDYYSYIPGDNSVIRLKCVVDGDNKTNSIYYVTANDFSTNLISHVVDPFGRTNFLKYDNQGRMTNITDVAGLSSSFIYDDRNWITNLTTPYGTTSFEITDGPLTNSFMKVAGRSILVAEADGSKQLFLYTNSAPGVASSYPNEVPNVSPFASSFETNNLNYRNSFHWDRKQYAALSTTNIGALTTNDFRKARMRHWLRSRNGTFGATLSLEREPSPDSTGAIEGQKTWYDYAGKISSAFEGRQIRPLIVAQVLPDGTTRFTRTQRNVIGWETNVVETYSLGSTVYLRTNALTYATNLIDLLTITNALGVQITSHAYNTNHQVLTNYNALDEMTVYSFDSTNRLATATFPSGLVLTNTYGGDGYLSQQIAVGIATNSYTWANALVATHTDPRGLTLTNTWDALERLRRVDYPDGTSVTNSFDKLDLVQMVDRMGFTTSFGYNAVRQLVAATNVNSVVARYGYCSCGALESVTNAFGTALQQVTQYTFDLQGNLTQAQYPDGYIVTHNYNALGQLTNTIDSSGTSLTNWFNNQGLPVVMSNAFGRVQSTVYDALDRATNSVDANGVSINATYDNLDRIRTRTYPDTGVESFGYTLNTAGVTSYTNQLNNVVNYAYDAMGRKTSEVYVGVMTNSFAYDGLDNLLTLTDGKSQTTSWNYDQFSRQTNKVDAATNILFVFKYDPNDRLTNRWTPTKGNTVYKYDPAGNLTNIVYAVSPAISMAYDVLNRMTDMTDAVGTTRYSYNTASQVLSEDGPWASDTVSFIYQNRLRSGLSVLAPNATAWSQTYGYDAAKRLTSVASPAGTFTYTYDAARKMQVMKISLPNGAYITNTFDSVARLTGTILKNTQRSTLINTATTPATRGHSKCSRRGTSWTTRMIRSAN